MFVLLVQELAVIHNLTTSRDIQDMIKFATQHYAQVAFQVQTHMNSFRMMCVTYYSNKSRPPRRHKSIKEAWEAEASNRDSRSANSVRRTWDALPAEAIKMEYNRVDNGFIDELQALLRRAVLEKNPTVYTRLVKDKEVSNPS